MPRPSKNLDIYLALNREIDLQKSWFRMKLEKHTRGRQKRDEIKQWVAHIPASALQGHMDESSYLQASLEWYRAKPWYQRWWLRRTTNVGWIARYYAYERGYHALHHWGDMYTSYHHLQDIRKQSQRYLAAFSWDRRKLTQSYKKLDQYWQQTIFAHRPSTTNKQRPAVVQKELIQLLTETDKKLRSLASTKSDGFFSSSPTYRELESQYQLTDLSLCEAKRKELTIAACQSNKDGWLGRFHPSKKIHTDRQVLYFSLLSRVVSNLLTDVKSPSFNAGNANWAELERLTTEGVYLSYGYSMRSRQPSKIWNVYNELFIGLSQLAFNPKAPEPAHINPWQMMVHKTGAWFHTLLQNIAGNSTSIASTDQRLCIEPYINLANAYKQSISDREKVLAANRMHEEGNTLKSLLREMKGNLNNTCNDLAHLQQQTVLVDIQTSGQGCKQSLQQLREQLEQFDAIVKKTHSAAPEPQAATTTLRLLIDAPPSVQWPERRYPASASSFFLPIPSSVPSPSSESIASSAATSTAASHLVIPTIRKEKKEFYEACKTLGLKINGNQKDILWETIRDAYKKKTKETHPDKCNGKNELFKEVNDAHTYLKEQHDKQVAKKQEEEQKRRLQEVKREGQERKRNIEKIDRNIEKIDRNIEKIDRNIEKIDRETEEIDRETEEIDRKIQEVDRKIQERDRAWQAQKLETIQSQKKEFAIFLATHRHDIEKLGKFWLKINHILQSGKAEDQELAQALKEDYINFIKEHYPQEYKMYEESNALAAAATATAQTPTVPLSQNSARFRYASTSNTSDPVANDIPSPSNAAAKMS